MLTNEKIKCSIYTNKNLEANKMITTLHIKNIGIIDDIVIDLNKGLNVLTGETGAGKTLIVDSLGIIAGGRFSKDMIRRGQNMSFVELALYLPDNPNSIDGNIVVSREINTSGKNLCKINGRLVTVNELKNFMKNIIDIHGQYDNQTLMDTEFHTKYLDKFIGTRIAEIHKKYVELYTEYIELNKMLKNNYGDEIEKQRKHISDLRQRLQQVLRHSKENAFKIVTEIPLLDNLIRQCYHHQSGTQLKFTQTNLKSTGTLQTKPHRQHFQFGRPVIQRYNALRIEKRYIIINNINVVGIYMFRMNYRRNTYFRNTLNIHTLSFFGDKYTSI